VFGDRLGDADDVRLLKSITAHHRSCDLPGDRDYGCAVHVRGGKAGDEIRRARA
jgi:hypothetical protein